MAKPDRIWNGLCSNSDIVISQGPTEPLPSGIPTYTVEIMNVCFSGCNISGIHLSCGWFSSARLVNPRIFKRLRFDDCLVNDGKPLLGGRTLSFRYANTFSYSLAVSSVTCWMLINTFSNPSPRYTENTYVRVSDKWVNSCTNYAHYSLITKNNLIVLIRLYLLFSFRCL